MLVASSRPRLRGHGRPLRVGALLLGVSALAACEAAAAKSRACSDACDTLIECGVPYDRGACGLSCQSSLVFANCARDVLDDCNELALCAFEQFSADSCGGSSGVPRGRDSCAAAADCQGTCSLTGGGPACACGCQAQLAPASALELLINDQCALALCPEFCLVPHLPSPACVTCFKQRCEDQSDQCTDEVPARSDSEPSDAGPADANRLGAGPADASPPKK